MHNARVNDAPRKQPASVLKVEANRRNALKSTGPRTAQGKANSRKNAVKHGLFVGRMETSFSKVMVNVKHLWIFTEDCGMSCNRSGLGRRTKLHTSPSAG
jgi:hypothetical protein